ncbi:MAG: hypothetical protein ACOCYT_02085 [Chloroflexota bacterium]
MMIFKQPEPEAIRQFEANYSRLLRQVEQMPDIVRRQVSSVVGSPAGASSYYRILEVFFADRQRMEDALMSTAGQRAGTEMAAFPAGSYEMIFAEVYEETGGQTSAANAAQGDND